MKQANCSRTVDAQMEIMAGQVALVSECFDGPIDVRGGQDRHYHLQLSMMPSSSAARSHGTAGRRSGPFSPMGDIFLLPPDAPVDIIGKCRKQRSLVCRLDPSSAAALFESCFEWTDDRLAFAFNIGNQEIRRLLFRLAGEMERPGRNSRLLVEALVTQIWVELGRLFSELGNARSTGGLAPWRMYIVEEELTENAARTSVKHIAGRCGLSERQLSRAYRQTRGETLSDAIFAARMACACRALEQGASVKQAAALAGYGAPSNFSAAFHRMTGCSPREYRARCKTMIN